MRREWLANFVAQDSYSVTRTVDGLPYFLALTDTAGQEEYRGLWAATNLKSDAFLLVYDITNGQSLEALGYFMDMIDIEAEQRLEDNERLIRELGPNDGDIVVGMPPPVKIIAGNKCDLKDSRVVSARDGLEYARKHGCGFMETSAREMVNIEETFALIVRRVVEARRLHKEQQQPPKQIEQEQPSEKMGASTSRAPASDAKEKTGDGRSRRGRFLGRTGTLRKRLNRASSSGGENEQRGNGSVQQNVTPETQSQAENDFAVDDYLPEGMTDIIDSSLEVQSSFPPFPDYDLDWPDVMGNLENFLVPDRLEFNGTPTRTVLAGEIYQERIIYSIKRMKAYPNVLLREGQTPFIHKKLYADAIPLPIQDALGICALYNEKNENNENLVFQTIRLKAGRLIETNSQPGLSLVERLSSVQALILFQIIRLFDGDVRQRADAENDAATLKEWTKQLQLRMESIDTTSAEVTSPSSSLTIDSWRSWVFSESLRRTVITSHGLLGLYCFLKNGWDDSHYDFEYLSFCGQRALWEAPSMYYWKTALSEKLPLPIHFNRWDDDVADAKPSDIEDLGMTMMVLMKGLDYCCQWAGSEHLERFGLSLV
ncbi:RAS small monomeric GTPase, putative [Paecilomyces variotii No. 5]|uniref:RAS small monomeric GTPase, putative n=1 Tax=Byssochlamys spectabilis (strain No. 5 / NBRC 109023) TaxID=1356009 RepID=V5HRY8_BYSSN|nr:RAS small monomeric GTPase, putative [Paecilomyces variotii No. 5]